MAIEAWLQWRRGEPMRPSWAGAPALVAAGFGIYLALNWSVYGDPLAFMAIQRLHWFKELKWPWEGIASVTGWFGDPNGDAALVYGWAEMAAIVVGGVATAATSVIVSNVAPTLDASVAASVISEGNSVTLDLAISDPSPLDTYNLAINWGDGTIQLLALPAGTTTFSVMHTYADDPVGLPDVYAISITLTDDDLGVLRRQVPGLQRQQRGCPVTAQPTRGAQGPGAVPVPTSRNMGQVVSR